MTDKARSRLMRWWCGLRSWVAEARRARAVLDFLQQEIVHEVDDARWTWHGDGPDRELRTAPKLARAAAMAIVAEQIAKIAAVGGDQLVIGWALLERHVQGWKGIEELRRWLGAPGNRRLRLRAADGADHKIDAQAWGLLPPPATPGGASEAEARETRWTPRDVAWISERLEDEWRLQAWRCGDEAEPTALLRTPVDFNSYSSYKGDISASWLRVHVLSGRVRQEGPPEHLPAPVSLWEPCGPAPRRREADLIRMERARGLASVVLQHLPFAAWGGEHADVIRRASQARQRHAFRVREALGNEPARVARVVRREPARLRDLVYLSTGHSGGKRRRVLFERYPALGSHALGNTPAEQRRHIGEAADEGQPVAAIVRLACKSVQPETDLTSGLVNDALRYFAGQEDWSLVKDRLEFWRAGRPTRGDAEDAALAMITGRVDDFSGVSGALKALLLSAPRQFAGWLEQNAPRLRDLASVLAGSLGWFTCYYSDDDELRRFVELGLAGMAWRAKALSAVDVLQDPADVVDMLADDLVAPRIRAEDGIVADPIGDARSIARRIVWGITFDPREGSTRWGALRRTCDQMHAAPVLAARDELLRAANGPWAFVAPEGWDALAPNRRAGVRRLADDAQIRQEGREMKHCVGTYGERVRAGECHLFHLECGDRAATLQVVEGRGAGGAAVYRVAQLCGPRNAKPSAELQKRARTLCDDLSAAARGLPEEDREAIRKQRARQAAAPRLDRRDPTPAEQHVLWERVYARRVPGPWKKLAPDREFPWRTWLARYASDGSAEPLESLMTPDWVYTARAARREAEQRAVPVARLLHLLDNGSGVSTRPLLRVLHNRRAGAGHPHSSPPSRRRPASRSGIA